MAFWLAWVLAWRELDVEDARGRVWERVAYATRYGRAGLADVLRLDHGHLEDYCRAVVKIVKQENESQGGGAFQNYT